MKNLILGAAGFIGTNLMLDLLKNKNNSVTAIDIKKEYFLVKDIHEYQNINIIESPMDETTDFVDLIKDHDVIYHLVSTIFPATSNQHIAEELTSNIAMTAHLLDACVENKISKVVFISSGGTVYGKNVSCPIGEMAQTNPVNSYGLQKLTIEKLLYVYNQMSGLDYRIIRLSNPYGPYQRPDGILGAATTFTYKALMNEAVTIYGDGSVIRDYIYIEDAIHAILNIVESDDEYKLYNVGSGTGTSINELLSIIQKQLKVTMNVNYMPGRKVDVPVNFLDISRYNNIYGSLYNTRLEAGIIKLSEFLKENYKIK